MTARWITTPLGLASLAGGFFLLYRNILRAIGGDGGAWGVLALFAVMVAVLSVAVLRYWTLVLDDRDALDVFKEAAVNLSAKPSHYRSDHKVGSGTITENGYRFRLAPGTCDIDVGLVQIGRTVAASKALQDEHTLLLLWIMPSVPVEMAIINPGVEVRETIDLERFAPGVFSSKHYAYCKHALVFSNYAKADVEAVFENLFIQNFLMEIFYHYRFKLIVFSKGHMLALKSVSVDSLGEDIDAYKLFVHLKELIEEQCKKQLSV